MKTNNIDSIAESISNDNKVRIAIQTIAGGLDDQRKNFLIKCYSSPTLARIYATMRNKNSIDGHLGKSKDRRHVAKFPNLIVYNFLNDYLSPKYGEDWITNNSKFAKVARNEELVRPWIIDKI